MYDVLFSYFFDFRGNNILPMGQIYCEFLPTDVVIVANRPAYYTMLKDRIIINKIDLFTNRDDIVLYNILPCHMQVIKNNLNDKFKNDTYFIKFLKLYEDGLTEAKELFKKVYKEKILRKYLHVPSLDISIPKFKILTEHDYSIYTTSTGTWTTSNGA